MIHEMDRRTVTRRQRTTEPEKPDRKKPIDHATMIATTKAVDYYLRNTRTASIEQLIYSRHCLLTDEKPTFRGSLKALHAKIVEYNEEIIYQDGDCADFAILDKTIQCQMYNKMELLRRHPSRIEKLSRRERKHLQDRGLSFDPKSVKKKKT